MHLYLGDLEQFANLLEKQTSKNIYIYIFFINPGKCYLPIWKDRTALLKTQAQLTYKRKTILQTHFVVLFSCVAVLLQV